MPPSRGSLRSSSRSRPATPTAASSACTEPTDLDGSEPGQPRRWISAKDDLGLLEAFPTNTLPHGGPYDAGQYNGISAVRLDDFDGDGRVDLVASGSVVWGRTDTADAVFLNRIDHTFPVVGAVDFDAEDNGWFTRTYLPNRGGNAFRSAGCSASGDLDHDGFPDLVLATGVLDERFPDPWGDLTYASCDRDPRQCNTWVVLRDAACVPPIGMQVGDVGYDSACYEIHPCWDCDDRHTNCACPDPCAGQEDCVSVQVSETTAWKGEGGAYERGPTAAYEHALLVFYNQGDGTFHAPVHLPASKATVATDCEVADLDGDGWDDVLVTSYHNDNLGTDVSEGRTWPLLTSPYAFARRAVHRDANRILLNPHTMGPWDAQLWVEVPITADTGKTYGVAVGDVDGNGELEIVLAGEGPFHLFEQR